MAVDVAVLRTRLAQLRRASVLTAHKLIEQHAWKRPLAVTLSVSTQPEASAIELFTTDLLVHTGRRFVPSILECYSPETAKAIVLQPEDVPNAALALDLLQNEPPPAFTQIQLTNIIKARPPPSPSCSSLSEKQP